MKIQTIVKDNWYTKKPNPSAFWVTTIISFFLFITSYFFLIDLFHSTRWMPASGETVFGQHQFWRLWTALFAHSDWGHLMNNSLLFIPLTYLITSYFGLYFFPLLGLLLGGVVNFIVIKTLPEDVLLIGISGVVYWLGAVWLTLFILIDSRKTYRRRFSIALFLTVLLLAPQTFRPEVSYLSHFTGYALGVISAIIYYFLNRQKFLNTEIKEYVFEDQDLPIFEQGDVPHQVLETVKARC